MSPVAPRTPGYRSSPYWHDDVELPRPAPAPLPAEADVVVVGGGYTGLSAALELARRGRHAVVLDADDIAAGASSRNGGMAHPGVKCSLPELLALPGGRGLWDDTVAAFDGVDALCRDLGIDCDWRRTGHVELAHHPRAARHLAAEADAYASIGEDARYVSRAELGAEVGSDRFFGGLVVARSAGLHPAKLAAGLARAAGAAGAALHGATEVTAIERSGPGHLVRTGRGVVRTGTVVVATNGTTDRRLVPWLGRRVLGIASTIIATEPLTADLAALVIPEGRMLFDTPNFLHYWRLSPDGRRVLFGGRTSFAPTTVEQSRDRLYADMVRLHPQLAGVRVDRAWGGQVGLTADRAPHVGRHDATGVVYAMGYCGTGVAMSTHFGAAVGRWLAGDGDLPPFAGRPWPRVPWPAHVPWLLPVAGWWFKGRDALGR